MIARLQKAITLGLVTAALAWLLYWIRQGRPILGGAGAGCLLLGHGLFLATEFSLLVWVGAEKAGPQARPGSMVRAWWGELAAAPLTFCWRQPFRSRIWPDRLPASARGRRGLLLVHGFVCNRGIWNAWLERLARQGTAWIAVDLEPAFGSIDQYTPIIESAVRRLETACGVPPVIVAHSMGGLAVRRWWSTQQDPRRIHHLVTIATPHRGTWLARWAFSTNARQMRCDSDWLKRLAHEESTDAPALCTCYYGDCDNIVFPAQRAIWPGARSMRLEGVAHVAMVARDEPWLEVQRLLSDLPAGDADSQRVKPASSS